jgi:hypothetical protein
MTGATLGVAFRRANMEVPKDRLISTLTWGPFVHTELWLNRGDERRPRTYGAFQGESGFMPSNPFRARDEQWVVVQYALPPGGYERVYAVMLQLLSMNLPYNSRDLWQCCIKVALPFEKDLDCERPDTWKGGVFCSQAALLVLRRLQRQGVLRHPGALRALIETTNSRGCSPNALYTLLEPAKKKKM